MVATDSSFLSLLLYPKAKGPLDPSTNKPVVRLEDRIEELIEELEEDGETIIIPTPALSEFLILAGKAGPQYLADISASPVFRVEAFDERAAVELAAMHVAAVAAGSKRGDSSETWAKIKFDRQIVAIAKVHNVTRLYCDDEGLAKFGQQQGLLVVRCWQLPLPKPKQTPLKYD